MSTHFNIVPAKVTTWLHIPTVKFSFLKILNFKYETLDGMSVFV